MYWKLIQELIQDTHKLHRKKTRSIPIFMGVPD